jgi:hypothetical protein
MSQSRTETQAIVLTDAELEVLWAAAAVLEVEGFDAEAKAIESLLARAGAEQEKEA